ncbi:FmdE family protein [Methanopyrus kandleri]|uniref:Protein containing a metal-binding domain shared with formylmethanofuran dehydrogenase subunit E n=1 Tax=Methanopyrus kandleri (strain AV19 / DSM 6324 / JCM 9639 / NBRC 100938) TaxID=190192 RepID=Q8TW59_METKA|nr:FmdE family protein [Methanopyrus kandleri]AAM02390.1 Protein containing a metal-binding domain shared with formylmethanofuran dehydrogenase subunit E [Methanopyrus kandleri AV19]
MLRAIAVVISALVLAVPALAEPQADLRALGEKIGNDALTTLGATAGDPKLLVITDARAVWVDSDGDGTPDTPAAAVADAVASETGCKIGENLVFVQSKPASDLFVAVFYGDESSGKLVFYRVTHSLLDRIARGEVSVDSLTFTSDPSDENGIYRYVLGDLTAENVFRELLSAAGIDPSGYMTDGRIDLQKLDEHGWDGFDPDKYTDEALQSFNDKYFGKMCGFGFTVLSIALSWANGLPRRYLASVERHDHLCPGLISGMLIVDKLLREGKAEAVRFYVACPIWCKDDAIYTTLDLTQGKRNHFVFHPDSRERDLLNRKLGGSPAGVFVLQEGEDLKALVATFKWVNWGAVFGKLARAGWGSVKGRVLNSMIRIICDVVFCRDWNVDRVGLKEYPMTCTEAAAICAGRDPYMVLGLVAPYTDDPKVAAVEQALLYARKVLGLSYGDERAYVITNVTYLKDFVDGRVRNVITRTLGLDATFSGSNRSIQVTTLEDRIVEFHTDETADPVIAVVNAETGEGVAVVLDLAKLEGKRAEDILTMDPEEFVKEYAKAYTDKVKMNAFEISDEDNDKLSRLGRYAFNVVTLATAVVNGVPKDLLRCAAWHNHFCPGVTSGWMIAKYIQEEILAKEPLKDNERLVWIGVPVWCKEDAVQTLLDLTPGKRGEFVMQLPREVQEELKREYGIDVAGILIRYQYTGKGKDEQILGGKAYVIGFDWDKANEIRPNVQYFGHAAWAVELAKRDPREFVRVIKEISLGAEDVKKLTEDTARVNPLEVVGVIHNPKPKRKPPVYWVTVALALTLLVFRRPLKPS